MKKFKVIEGNRLLNPERILAGGGIGNIGTLCPTGNHAVLCQYTHGTCNQGQTNYSSEPCYGGGTYHTCGMWAAYDVNCNWFFNLLYLSSRTSISFLIYNLE